MVKASMMSPVPEKLRFPEASPAATILGGQSPPAARFPLTMKRLDPLTRARRRAAQEGGRGPWRRGESVPYLGISSMVKASIMSPSLMSLNFSTVRPHS